ncbi:hypothetical protein PENSPDRAFT_600802 [Peniophora sp. CONT]|nr:hypothetical protein PENSPDRAFT_600802 [Peniophora sp. CONT]
MLQPTTPLARPATGAHRAVANVNDDYERWYMEGTNNNRMLLSIRSGILTEIGWALDRLCRLAQNDQFFIRNIPGLLDALFEWPEWYLVQAGDSTSKSRSLFCAPPDVERKRRFALDSLAILRNASLNESNAGDISQHKKTKPLVLASLFTLRATTDADSEFLLYCIELLHLVVPGWVIPPRSQGAMNPIPRLLDMSANSSNRSIIIGSLHALHIIFSTPANSVHLTADSPALEASLRYLPLLQDKPLIDACVNYLYTHLSHPPMAKAFLSHPNLTSALKLLVNHILSEQVLEEQSRAVGPQLVTTPLVASPVARPHELTQAEIATLLTLQEPARCFEWMNMMFTEKADGEMTQVEFWTQYRDRFSQLTPGNTLPAADVIKHVTAIFPQAQAMVVNIGTTQRFVVRGVARRTDDVSAERLKCAWGRVQCDAPPCASAGALADHVLEHVNAIEEVEHECMWGLCPQTALSKDALRRHVLTHLPESQPTPLHPEQGNTISLPSANFPNPIPNPTTRPHPPAGKDSIPIKKVLIDPPSSALTSLLCVRVLFRTANASVETAPKRDADHFGFPGVVEDEEEDVQEDTTMDEREEQALERGKRAFMRVRGLLSEVLIKQDTLQGWVTEMVQASM